MPNPPRFEVRVYHGGSWLERDEGGDYTTWGVWDYYHEQWVEESLPLREAERLARHMNNLSNPSEE